MTLMKQNSADSSRGRLTRAITRPPFQNFPVAKGGLKGSAALNHTKHVIFNWILEDGRVGRDRSVLHFSQTFTPGHIQTMCRD